MTGLAEVLRGLAARDGVHGALLPSGEALPTAHAGGELESGAVAGPLLSDLRRHGPAPATVIR